MKDTDPYPSHKNRSGVLRAHPDDTSRSTSDLETEMDRIDVSVHGKPLRHDHERYVRDIALYEQGV